MDCRFWYFKLLKITNYGYSNCWKLREECHKTSDTDIGRIGCNEICDSFEQSIVPCPPQDRGFFGMLTANAAKDLSFPFDWSFSKISRSWVCGSFKEPADFLPQ